jgi:hypothetical protein
MAKITNALRRKSFERPLLLKKVSLFSRIKHFKSLMGTKNFQTLFQSLGFLVFHSVLLSVNLKAKVSKPKFL